MHDLQDLLDSEFQKEDVAGASIAVWTRGQLHTAACGVLSTETQFPVTRNSMFQIGSITKALTTTLVMQLVDAGRVDLDKPVRAYLPEFEIGDPDARDEILVRNLLNHTSGMDGDFFTDAGWGPDCLRRFVDRCALLPQLHPVGQQFAYCNAGFAIAGRLIEVVTGRQFEQVMHDNLFKPLGLAHAEILPHRLLGRPAAVGHNEQDGKLVPADQGYFPFSMGPAGATSTLSAADLVTFLRMHVDGGVAQDGVRILSESSVKAMQQEEVRLPCYTKSQEHAPANVELHGWGLGWMRFRWVGCDLIGHDGTTNGQLAFCRFSPQHEAIVVLLTNGGTMPGLRRLSRSLLNQTIGELCNAKMPEFPSYNDKLPENVGRYLGEYARTGTGIRLRLDDQGLVVIASPRRAEDSTASSIQTLRHVEGDTFAALDSNGEIAQLCTFLGQDEAGRARYFFTGVRLTPRVD